MGMQQAPRPRRSPWVRYAPFIAIVAIAAIVAVALATRSDNKKNTVAVGGNAVATQSGVNGVLLFYNDAKKKGEVAKYTWQDHCDTTTGYVAIPIINPPPCVPKAAGDNGGATSPGVTADTIRIGYYVSKADPLSGRRAITPRRWPRSVMASGRKPIPCCATSAGSSRAKATLPWSRSTLGP